MPVDLAIAAGPVVEIELLMAPGSGSPREAGKARTLARDDSRTNIGPVPSCCYRPRDRWTVPPGW
jgi:hypothetical protein